MKDLRQITVIGLGLLGGSITLRILRSLPGVKTVGYTHRPSTREKARQLAVATEIVDDMHESVSGSDLVILATPIYTFENIFSIIGDALPSGCIVTDVGSTKVLPHRWAAKKLPKTVHYVGSHPVAGSEQRGVEFARDDLFDQTVCILTMTKTTNRRAVQTLKRFWSDLGCSVKLMTPVNHDRTFANISHLPHIAAAALINSNISKDLKFAGKGFLDTSRIASSPANIWADVLLTNADNTTKGIDRIVGELLKIKKAIKNQNKHKIEDLLKAAGKKRSTMINYKIKNKELIS
ncbi:MAG: prephenate dehydrogenase [Planctomycetota bacterium]|jgi:prephenate dehydrogenase